MTKRVAWFTGESTKGSVTPHKVYAVFKEDENSFNLKDDSGETRLCLKKGCAHICQGDWVFADIVEEEVVEQPPVETKPKKAKKWSKWIETKTGKKPVGLSDEQTVKCKWGDGDVTMGMAGERLWYISSNNITHYKFLLEDGYKEQPKQDAKQNTDWQDNVLGKSPVPYGTRVEVILQNGETVFGETFNWGKTPIKGRNIVKWRLAE